MAAENTCRSCGTTLDDTVSDGDCPTCLIQLGIDAGVSRETQDLVAPTIDEMSARLPDFDVTEVVGRGGMGVVYRARQKRLDRDVAIKVLLEDAAAHVISAERFVREAKALAKLHHQHIVTAFDAGEVDGLSYLVMQFVDGCDLRTLIAESGPVGGAEAIDWVLQAARGLEYAHRKGIVHRDIKPGNLLLDEDGVVRVLDLGLARFDDDRIDRRKVRDRPGSEHTADRHLTGSGHVLGTVDFMAPEQAVDTHAADARSDVYSLGCTLYYLLTGQAIFDGDSVVKRIIAHREQEPPKLPESLTADMPGLSNVYHRMVAKDADSRPQSMTQVIAELEAVLREERVGDSPTDQGTSTSAKRSVAPQPADRNESAETHVRRPGPADETVVLANTADTDLGTSLRTPSPERQTDDTKQRTTLKLLFAGVVALLAFVVYRIQTDNGTLVVRVDPAHSKDIDLLLRDQGLKVDDHHSGQKWSVRPGDSQKLGSSDWKIARRDGLKLSVRNESGLELDPERFIVRRNDRIILDVSLEPTQRTAPSSPSQSRSAIVKGPARTEPPQPDPLVFQRVEQSSGPGHTAGVTFADPDEDGDLDAIVASYRGAPTPVWLNNGHGQFSPGAGFTSDRTTAVQLEDLNGDGHLDAFLTSRHVGNSVWFGDGKGAFTRSDQEPGRGICRDVELRDFDGDGDVDAMLAFGGSGSTEGNRLYINDGTGMMQPGEQVLGSRASWSVAADDLDGDGDLDVVFANGDFRDQPTGWQPNSVWLNDGTGKFTETSQSFPNSHCFSVSLGDLDGDGDPDAAFAGYDRRCTIWLNDGTGTFTESDVRLPIGLWCASGIADLDRDGDLDVVFCSKRGLIQLLLNNGHGAFPQTMDLMAEDGVESGLALDDIDGDDDVDVYVGFGPKSDSIWFNQLVPTPPSETPQPRSLDLPEKLFTRLNEEEVGIKVHDPDWELRLAFETRVGVNSTTIAPHDQQLYVGFGHVTSDEGKRLRGGLFRVSDDGDFEEIVRDTVYNPTFTSDGKRCFFENNFFGNLVEWDLANDTQVRSVDMGPGDETPASPHFAPPWYEGDLIASDEYLMADFGSRKGDTGGVWKWGSELAAPVRLFDTHSPPPFNHVWALTFTTDRVLAMVTRDCDVNTCGQICTFDGTAVEPIPGLPLLLPPGSLEFDPHSGDVLVSSENGSQIDRLPVVGNTDDVPQPKPFADGFDGLRNGTLRLSIDQQYLSVTDSSRVYVFARRDSPELKLASGARAKFPAPPETWALTCTFGTDGPLNPSDYGLTQHEAGWDLTAVYSASHTELHSTQISPFDDQVYLGSGPGGLLRFAVDGSSPQQVHREHGLEFAISPDGHFVTQVSGLNGLMNVIDLHTGEVLQTAEMNPGRDDDPTGLKYPPPWYQGSTVARNTCLFVDKGYKGTSGIWQWSVGANRPERLLAESPETGKITGVAFGRDQIFVVQNPHGISTFDGMALKRVPMAEDIPRPNGMTFDVLTGDLLVSHERPSSTVVRVGIGASERPASVEPVISGFVNLFDGAVHMSQDGQSLLITDRDARRIYLFTRSKTAG